MAEAIRVWEVQGEALSEVRREPLDLEGRLETWIASDINVLSDDLLVIGRQLETDAGGYVDLLCLDRQGDLVVVELKRDKTPREVTAQALDYGAWVRRLSNEQVRSIAEAYLAMPLEDAFRQRFKEELPEVLNAAHHLLIVATAVDGRSERIIRYLSDEYGVSINAVTFNYYRSKEGRELLARAHLLEPQQVEQRTNERGGSKRSRNATPAEMEAIADERGVGPAYRQLAEALGSRFSLESMRSVVSFYWKEGETWLSVFNLVPGESTEELGVRYRAYVNRLSRALKLTPEAIHDILPTASEPWSYYADASEDYQGRAGYFRTEQEVKQFISKLISAPL